MKKFFAIICAAVLISGCGEETPAVQKLARNKINLDSAKDGIYIVESSRDAELGNGTLTLTIKDKKIVAAIKVYPAQLVATQDLGAVDAISGATISYNQFVETVKRAVAEASR